MVAAGDVRARVVCLRFVCFWDDVGRVFASRGCQRLRAGSSWMGFDVEECVGCVCGV